MCILTAEELEKKLEAERKFWLKVSKTNIFARHNRPGFQVIAYSMSIASKSAAAMILPLPVVPGSGEEAIRFIDLSGYEDFFYDMELACRRNEIEEESLCLESPDETPELLKVHEVGDFEASYVPTMADFTRLDPRFRLSDEIWKKMPDYSDYGFAVFQLKLTLMNDDVEKENTVHPMAFEFPTRDDKHLYFPTVHVHDGDFHPEAGFYHTFYCQRENARAEFKYQRDLLEGLQPTPVKLTSEILAINSEFNSGEWLDQMFKLMFDNEEFEFYEWYLQSWEPASKVMDIDRSQGLLDPGEKLHGMSLFGDYPNRDIWLGDSL